MATIGNMSSSSKTAVRNAARTSVREARRRPNMMLPKDIGAIKATAVSVTPNSGSIAVNGTKNGLTATLAWTPTNADFKSGTWTSANPAVVRVDDAALGNFTGLTAGSSVLTFTAHDGVTTTYTLTVTA